MIREIVLDTESTGLDPKSGHRVIEIGCMELVGHLPTGKNLQLYINPERDVPLEAQNVHGLTEEFLKDKPKFADIADEFLAFIDGARLVIHNAPFDMGFLNYELSLLGRPALDVEVVDTVVLARKKFPGARASLDALCQRFNIDNSHREFHGALKDVELLAKVYLELLGGRQTGLTLGAGQSTTFETTEISYANLALRAPRPQTVPANEASAHEAFIKKLKNPLWGSA